MTENSKTWLLIADASKARLYSMHKALFIQHQKPSNLELLNEFTHQASRKKSAELISDKMGEFGSGTFVEATPPKTHEAEVFALQLLDHIETGRKGGNFRDLIIVAPPTFMGMLHKHMPREVHKVVSQTIEKDYTQQTELKLIQSLLNHF